MKVRNILVLMSLALLLLTCYFLLVPSFSVGTTPRASAFSTSMLASSTPTVVPTPTTTPPNLSDTITNFEDTISGPLIAALKLVAAFVILVLIFPLFFHLFILYWRRFYQYNLVVGPFNNATGNDGLNSLTREDLSPQLAYVSKFVPGLDFFNQSAEAVLSNPLQTTLDTLEKAISGDAFKSGEVGAALQLLNLLVSPRGSNVTITLQSKGDLPATLGMSIEVADLQGKQKPTLHTIWEPFPTVDQKLLASSGQETKLEKQAMMRPPLEKLIRIFRSLALLFRFTKSGHEPDNTAPTSPNPKEVIDKEAQGYYTVGQLYEKREAFDEAKSHYESALSKQPDYQDAINALQEVLAKRKTTQDRYIALQTPVARWLAIEIVKRSIEAHLPFRTRWSKKRQDNYRAQIYNLIGEIYESSGQLFDIYPSFYDLAIHNFNLASASHEPWFQPYENLADTFVMLVQGKSVPVQPSDDDRERLYQALSNYNKALNRHPNREQKRRVNVGKATAQLMKGDTVNAITTIKEIVKNNWIGEQEKDSQLLYNLACWYGIAVSRESGVPNAKQMARRNLAYSLGRDKSKELWTWAFADPSFANISDTSNGIQKDLKLLTLALTQKIDEMPDLWEAQSDKFKAAMDQVLRTANWF